MCGIGGILRTDGGAIPEAWLDAIDARIAYRGPDGSGRFHDRISCTDDHGVQRIVEVALVHRRLSIIDHQDGGQPMVSDRGRDTGEGLVAVVFNGCIYNHRALRQALESRGHVFETDHSDTEVLVHGWREWGEQLPEHLEGMYAFAVWDRSRAQLFLARDVFGEKPLYFTDNVWRVDENSWRREPSPMFAFSSEICTLQRMTDSIRADVDENRFALDLVRLGYTRTADDDIDGTKELEHGSAFLGDCRGWFGFNAVGSHRLTEEPPARLPEGERGGPDAQCPMPDASRIESLIEQAVARRLEADVPLGCFLSGGVDSSLIAHFAKFHKPDLMTFTVRMPDERYDESAHAEAVARHLGTDHYTLDVAMNPAADLVHLIGLLGQPFGDSSILPTYWVSKAASEQVKVALSGDGGDELFIGYERYMAAPILAQHWWWLRFLPTSFLHRTHRKSKWNKLARLVGMARDYRIVGLASTEAIFAEPDLDQLLRGPDEVPEVDRHAPSPAPWAPMPSSTSNSGCIAALRHFDLQNYLPGDLLRKVDTASMAVALEVRCPFLDRDLSRAALAMPIRELIPGGQRKGLLRRIARRHLPPELVDRPKMGFAIPIGEWFRNDYGGMKTLLLDHLESAEPFGPIKLDQGLVRRLIDEHMRGARDHGHRLFTLLTLSVWATQAHA